MRRNPPRLLGEDHPHHILSAAQVIEARQLRRAGVSTSEIARRMGVSRQCVQAVISGRNWSHLQDAAEAAA